MGNGSGLADETVYKEGLFGVGGFPFLLSLLVLMYSKQQYDFEKYSCSCSLIHTSSSAKQHPHYLRLTPPSTLEPVFNKLT
jgi:hypothetical protein